MSERLLILGGGGHGKVVADVARSAGYVIAGYADADDSTIGRIVEPGGSAVSVTQDDLIESVRSEGALPCNADAVAVAVGSNRGRMQLAQMLDAASAPALIHASALVSSSVRIGRFTVVFPGAIINADTSIGLAVIINTGAIIEHDCLIEGGAHISPGAILGGGVTVGSRTWIGAGATVIHGIRIGSDAVVGAGAVVIRDVPDGVTVVGCPAGPIRS